MLRDSKQDYVLVPEFSAKCGSTVHDILNLFTRAGIKMNQHSVVYEKHVVALSEYLNRLSVAEWFVSERENQPTFLDAQSTPLVYDLKRPPDPSKKYLNKLVQWLYIESETETEAYIHGLALEALKEAYSGNGFSKATYLLENMAGWELDLLFWFGSFGIRFMQCPKTFEEDAEPLIVWLRNNKCEEIYRPNFNAQIAYKKFNSNHLLKRACITPVETIGFLYTASYGLDQERKIHAIAIRALHEAYNGNIFIAEWLVSRFQTKQMSTALLRWFGAFGLNATSDFHLPLSKSFSLVPESVFH